MRIFKKMLLGVLVLIVLAAIVLFFGIRYEVGLQSGAQTDTVNPEGYFDTYEVIGIKNAHVLQSGDSLYFAQRNLVLESGKIRSVDSVSVLLPGVGYIEGREKFVIPGFIDSHVHLENSKNDLYLYLANGVTSVFEMYGTENHLEWKKAVKKGGIGPRMKVASSKITSPGGIAPKIDQFFGGAVAWSSEEAVDRGVQELKRKGFDALKLSSNLNERIYRAINIRAAEMDIPVTGHLSVDAGLDALYASHQSQLAHVEEIMKNMMHDFGGLESGNTDEFLEYLREESGRVAETLRKLDISVFTTVWLMVILENQALDLEDFLKTIELEYANPGIMEGSNIRQGWLPGNNSYEFGGTLEAERDWERLFWKTYREGIEIVTKALDDKGVKWLVGTDSNVPGVVPGFSFHEELRSLSEFGISNESILKAATMEAARSMNFESGQIGPGYNSDLLILAENPLENIRNSATVESVIFGSYILNSEGRTRLLSEIRRVNDKNRSEDI